MNYLPNILTVLRIFLTIGFISAFVIWKGLTGITAALVLFTLASATDFFDGYLAKKHDLITNFGKIMDPIADKFLMLAAFYMFMKLGLIAGWMFWAIFARELLVTGFRFYAMGRKLFLSAAPAGKCKTVLQIAAVYVILIYIFLEKAGVFSHVRDEVLRQNSLRVCLTGIEVLMWMVIALTFYSGSSYLWNNLEAVFSKNE